MEISGKATLASWIKTWSRYEKEVQKATVSGTNGKKKLAKTLSVDAGREFPPRRPDPEDLTLRRNYQ